MSFVWTVDDPLVSADSNYTASGSYLPGVPNVPAFPGVPQLTRVGGTGIGLIGGAEIIASELGLSGQVAFGNRLYSGILLDVLPAGVLPQYAILDSNRNPALAPDSVIEADFRLDSDIMTHPIEEGGFAAYNRQQEAIVVRLQLACSGANQYSGGMTRDGFIATLRALREGTQLVTIVTPDATYPNMALKGLGYRKTASRGAVTIWADTTWMEARSTGVTVSSAPTSQPYGAATSNLGALQPQGLDSSQFAAVGSPSTAPAPLPARLIEVPPSGAAF
jgi:hypothetical protein